MELTRAQVQELPASALKLVSADLQKLIADAQQHIHSLRRSWVVVQREIEFRKRGNDAPSE